MARTRRKSATTQTITANKLSRAQQQQLKGILRHKIIERLVNDVMANPPELDLNRVKIKLPAGQSVKDLDVLGANWVVTGGCETCSAIGGGGGCETCSAIGKATSGGCETCSAIGGGCDTCSAIGGGCDTCSAIGKAA